MKQLKTFLMEELDNIFESNEVSFLLLDFESAMTYFNEHKTFEKKKIIEMGLTADIIKQLYEWYDEYQLPCPIVANYERKPGNFVFRRWVGKYSDELPIELYKKYGPYQGLHNTRLKEDGKYFPSAEDYEYIIAYSHNKNNNDIPDPENIELVTSKQLESNSKLEQIMLYYAQNENSCKMLSYSLKNISSNLYKLPNVKTTTSEWKKLGNYKKEPNKTPKTDIISDDNKYRISVKKCKDGSQLMSGGECESRATLLSCIDYLKSDADKKLLIDLCNLEWKIPSKTGKTAKERRASGDEEILSIDKNNKHKTEILNSIVENPVNIEFKKAVMYEAATGEKKFGANSPATANYILVWDDLNQNNNHLYNIKDYIESKVNSAKFNIGFKTAKDVGIAMRIAIK